MIKTCSACGYDFEGRSSDSTCSSECYRGEPKMIKPPPEVIEAHVPYMKPKAVKKKVVRQRKIYNRHFLRTRTDWKELSAESLSKISKKTSGVIYDNSL